MTTYRSCRLIANRNLPNDRRHGRDFIDADLFHWGDISTVFLKWTPSTNTNIFSRYGCVRTALCVGLRLSARVV